MTDDIDNDGTTLHESGGVGLRGFPLRILKLLQEVAGRNSTPPYGPWEDGEGEPLQDDADAALRWIAACPHGDGWVSVEERIPPAVMYCMVYGRKYGTRPNTRVVFMTFISTRPRECVEDEEITHWMPLPAAPTAEDRSQS